MDLQDLSFATFNLLNLNRARRPMYRDREGWSEDEVTAKVAWTAGLLARAQADVIGFQELWHPAPLLDALDWAGLGESHELVAPPGLDGQGIACAAAVRRGLLLGEPEWITAFPEGFDLRSGGDDAQTEAISVAIDAFSRPVLHLAIRPREDRGPLHVFVAHLKSKRPTEIGEEGWFEEIHKPHRTALGSALSTIRRTAEAAALRMIVTAIVKGTDAPAVVLGDLNDGGETPTLDLLTEQPRLLAPTSRGGGGDTALYSAQALQQARSQRDVYYTYIHQEVHGSLDHVLVSRELYDMSRNRLWRFEGLDILNDHLDQGEAGANDHGVVRARFAWDPV